MYEEDLKRIVCLYPQLIEEGLVIDQEEYPIRSSSGATYRCDLKGRDKNQRTVFVELKLNADKGVIYQIAKYMTYAEQEGRYIVAAFSIDGETQDVLARLGFETRIISQEKAARLLEQERPNPKLYERKTALAKASVGPFKSNVATKVYSDDERAIVHAFMSELHELVQANSAYTQGFVVQGLDVRKSDEFRLMLHSTEFPNDRIVIYNRARKRNELHLLYVPDFSFSPGTTEKKGLFRDFIDERRGKLAAIFEMPFYAPRNSALGSHLENTKQAWKGFSQVIVRDVSLWDQPDYVEMVGAKFFDFCENVVPYVREFYEKGHGDVV